VGERRAGRKRAGEVASGKVAAQQRKALAAVFSIWRAWAHRNRVVSKAGERYSATKGALKARAAVVRWRAWRARMEEDKARLACIHSACFVVRVKGLVRLWRGFARVHGKERRLVAACELQVRRPAALRRAVREWREKGRVWHAARILHERALGVLGKVKLSHSLLAWTAHTRAALLVAAMSSTVREKSLVLRALRGVRLWRASTLLVKRVRKGALILARKLWEAECARLLRLTFDAWKRLRVRGKLAKGVAGKHSSALLRAALKTWYSVMLAVKASHGPRYRLLRKAFAGWKAQWQAGRGRRRLGTLALGKCMQSSDTRWLWLAFYTWRRKVEEGNMQVALLRRVFKRWASYVAAHAARRRDLQGRGEEWLALRVLHWVVRWRVWARQGE